MVHGRKTQSQMIQKKTCRREQEVRMKEGWSDRLDTDLNRKRRNRIRARWRGGTEETDSEIESAKEQ